MPPVVGRHASAAGPFSSSVCSCSSCTHSRLSGCGSGALATTGWKAMWPLLLRDQAPPASVVKCGARVVRRSATAAGRGGPSWLHETVGVTLRRLLETAARLARGRAAASRLWSRLRTTLLRCSVSSFASSLTFAASSSSSWRFRARLARRSEAYVRREDREVAAAASAASLSATVRGTPGWLRQGGAKVREGSASGFTANERTRVLSPFSCRR